MIYFSKKKKKKKEEDKFNQLTIILTLPHSHFGP